MILGGHVEFSKSGPVATIPGGNTPLLAPEKRTRLLILLPDLRVFGSRQT
jgi:hypothetical protein